MSTPCIVNTETSRLSIDQIVYTNILFYLWLIGNITGVDELDLDANEAKPEILINLMLQTKIL